MSVDQFLEEFQNLQKKIQNFKDVIRNLYTLNDKIYEEKTGQRFDSI